MHTNKLPNPAWLVENRATHCAYITVQEESDLAYEEEILRHPYQVKCWIRYIDHKSAAPKSVINLIYERALKQLPGR